MNQANDKTLDFIEGLSDIINKAQLNGITAEDLGTLLLGAGLKIASCDNAKFPMILSSSIAVFMQDNIKDTLSTGKSKKENLHKGLADLVSINAIVAYNLAGEFGVNIDKLKKECEYILNKVHETYHGNDGKIGLNVNKRKTIDIRVSASKEEAVKFANFSPFDDPSNNNLKRGVLTIDDNGFVINALTGERISGELASELLASIDGDEGKFNIDSDVNDLIKERNMTEDELTTKIKAALKKQLC